MINGKCDVCAQREPIGVFSSALGPVSFAYCAECGASGREPYWLVVGVVAMNGGTPDATAAWALDVARVSWEAEGKSAVEFWSNVRTEAARLPGAEEKR